jgi:hypothetical protein
MSDRKQNYIVKVKKIKIPTLTKQKALNRERTIQQTNFQLSKGGGGGGGERAAAGGARPRGGEGARPGGREGPNGAGGGGGV